MDIQELYERAVSRRNFLMGAGAVGAASVLAGCNDASAPAPTSTVPVTTTPVATTMAPITTTPVVTTTPVATPAPYTDTDILNFALNLEYVEAEFYLRAATGSGLAAGDIGTNPGAVTGGTKVTANAAGTALTTFQQNFINELAYTEQQHVRALRAALSSAAVARPAIDLTGGFAGGVTAANTLSSPLPAIPTAFNAFANYDAFLVGAFLFEDVGVTAYSGAAPLLSASAVSKGVLDTAAGILSVEAYHGAAIRTQLTAFAILQGTTAYPYPLYANRLALLRAALTGTIVQTGTAMAGTPQIGGETQLTGFLAAPATVANVTASSIVNADTNAIGFSRTFDQVLHIVYGTFSPTAGSTTLAAGVTKGGFLPAGATGNINTTRS